MQVQVEDYYVVYTTARFSTWTCARLQLQAYLSMSRQQGSDNKEIGSTMSIELFQFPQEAAAAIGRKIEAISKVVETDVIE